MENKYFTPDIEDIRVGYECRIRYQNFETKEDYYKDNHIVKEERVPIDDRYGNYTSDLDLMWGLFRLGRIDVPYLTKEQIEAEGFQIAFGKDRYFKGRTTVDLLSENTILISQNSSVVFCGECKDINTFRYICKLLGI